MRASAIPCILRTWLALLGAACATACGSAAIAPSILARAREVVLTERFTTGRLAGQRWRRCEAIAPSNVIPRSACGVRMDPSAPGFAAYARAAAAISRAASIDSSSAALYASGLMDLRGAAESRKGLDRAVASLERARDRDPLNEALWNDLAVAYMAVGERDQALMPMLHALDAVDGALRRDAGYAPALFNRALILQRLFLVKSARDAWSAYTVVDGDHRWKAEGRAHVRELLQLDDSLAERFFSQRARERIFVLLGRWGVAVRERRQPLADSLLAWSFALVDSLGTDTDQSAALMVAWLRGDAGRQGADPRAARGLADLADGIALHDRGSYAAGESTLASAENALRAVGAPAARWAAVYRAACEANQTKFAPADSRLQRAIQEATGREPALLGKALWLRGIIHLRRGNYESAIRSYGEAKSLFVRAGDAMNEAAMSFLMTESNALAGREAASEEEAYKGLRGLAPFRRSHYLSNLLIRVAAHARESGLRSATLDVLTEALSVVEGLQSATSTAYVRWTRAADLAAVGDSARAFAELDTAATAAGIATGAMGIRALADVDLTKGRLLLHRSPQAAQRSLDRAVSAYRTLGAVNVLPSALYESAVLARLAGDRETSRTRLSEAIDVIERRRASFTSAEAQVAYYETVERVFDAAIALELERDRSEAAYELLERARIAVRPRADARTSIAATRLRTIASTVPNDLLLVTYALLDDRVAIWSVQRGTWRFHTVPVRRDTVAMLAARATREVVCGVGSASATTRLFDILLRPVGDDLRHARALAVVPDRELVAVPFGALRDSVTGRCVIESTAVLTEPSASFLVAASRVHGARGTLSAFVVGNPSSQSDPSLTDLPGAAAEAERVAAVYPRRELLTGRAANRAAVVQGVSRHAVFHFAGHAVFDAVRPERSYLALHDSDGTGVGRLEAWEIARMNLSKARVVVLSACRTLPGKPTHSGAVAGLAFSFLGAGAPAIVSTLWDVADDATTGVVVEFHRGLREGIPPAEALRRAQVAALHSTANPGREATSWAAFVYTGPWTVNARSD